MTKQRAEELLATDLQVATGAEWTREHRPHPTRKWRIDLCLLDKKLAVEIDGMRHGSAQQRRSDNEKSNYLTAHKWRCFRYPASSVFNKKRRARIVDQLHRVLCNVHDAEQDGCVLVGD